MRRGRRVHDRDKTFRRQAKSNRVIQNASILRENMGIGAVARLGRHPIAVDVFDKTVGIGARDENLSHVGNIKHAAGRSNGLVLGQNT